MLNKRDGTPGRAVAPVVFASALAVSGSESGPFQWYGAHPVDGSTALATPQVHLDHQLFTDRDGSLHINWDFKAGVFLDGVIDDMWAAYRAALVRLATKPSAWSERMIAVPPAHVNKYREIQANEKRPDLLSKLQLLHAPLKHGRLEKEKAVVGTDGSLSFADLSLLAQHYARQVRSAVATPVAVLIEKSCCQVVAVFAALLAGRAYVPVATHQPGSRILQILNAIEASVLLKTAGVHDDLEVPATCKSLEVTLNAAVELPNVLADPSVSLDDLAYVIFTSGSTGTPKGVAITHRGAANTCADINERFAVTEADTVLSLASLAFDLSVYDLFGVLMGGGRLVLPDPQYSNDPDHWLDLLERERVTVWNTAPPMMAMLLETVARDDSARSRFRRLPLRVVLLSGDFCPLWVPPRLVELLPNADVSTLGGATEASIWSCFFRPPLDIPASWTSIPYGFPLANQTLAVVDEHLRLVPPLVPGEIVIGGVGLASGYWKDPEKTAAAFRWTNFDGARERLYKTGDLGRTNRDGRVEILGRLDFQVKVHGYRVEIGEVEAALSPHCNACVVLPVGPVNARELVAFLDAPEDAKDLALASAREKLPHYMVPVAVYCLPEGLPQSANGKVDRKQLQSLHQPKDWTLCAEVTARTATERVVSDIYKEMLGLDGAPSIFSKFSELGGTSVTLNRLRLRIADAFGLRPPLPVLLTHPTVAALAQWLDAETGQSLTPQVVCFNAAGALPPLFLVAPVGGHVVCYSALAQELGADQPVYALQSVGINDGESTVGSVERAAELLVSQVLIVMKDRRATEFALGGWSMGGVVAFEMRQQLRRLGQGTVTALILLDSPAPIGDPCAPLDQPSCFLSFAADMLSCSGSPVVSAEDVAGPDARAILVARLAERLQLSPDLVDRTLTVYSSNVAALGAYRPQPENDNTLVHLLRASGPTQPHLSRYAGHERLDFGWTELVQPSQLLLTMVSGDHYFMTDDSSTSAVARLVGRCLRPAVQHESWKVEVGPSILRRTRFTAGTRGDTEFRCGTGASSEATLERAVVEAYAAVLRALGAPPTLIVASVDACFAGAEVLALLETLAPFAVIHGTTGCKGALTERGNATVGLLGIHDPEGRYTCGITAGAGDPSTARAAAKSSVRQALERTPRHVNPACVLLAVAPGSEEEVLAGVEEVLGPDVPVLGGSTAANGWQMGRMPHTAGKAAADSVAITLLWPSVPTRLVFSSCYQPTAARGVITEVTGRSIVSIDGKPAADVYAAWTKSSAFRAKLRAAPADVLAETTLAPLARKLGDGSFCNVHPASVHTDGSLTCYADCHVGDDLVLMRSTPQLLGKHPCSVLASAADMAASGALIMYCAGCMLQIESEIDAVAQDFASSLRQPFLATFPFGEQGREGGKNRHGNLMYAVLLFGVSESSQAEVPRTLWSTHSSVFLVRYRTPPSSSPEVIELFRSKLLEGEPLRPCREALQLWNIAEETEYSCELPGSKAKIFVHPLQYRMVLDALKGAELHQFHVIVAEEYYEALQATVQSIPYKKRPREKTVTEMDLEPELAPAPERTRATSDENEWLAEERTFVCFAPTSPSSK
jgi:amino acid adenylation domain-containing protein